MATLDLIKEAFIVYMTYFGSKITIHLTCQAQIALLIAKEIIVLSNYLDFADVLLKESAIELPDHSDINKYSINLELDK